MTDLLYVYSSFYSFLFIHVSYLYKKGGVGGEAKNCKLTIFVSSQSYYLIIHTYYTFSFLLFFKFFLFLFFNLFIYFFFFYEKD